ncbi:hypothetical protein GQ602_006005 [Ophiocordyceps camponoti-floridani]|uniref:Uncharacterized protein n=1 Tax=Ophiocordyceps camponoti-floridani TaxID=2030778 RepID=A0A8H4Q2I1_9HYPO|nr:hypothetical protein GQ602_006005 [Ophiocordyceps camponoti-floridani]
MTTVNLSKLGILTGPFRQQQHASQFINRQMQSVPRRLFNKSNKTTMQHGIESRLEQVNHLHQPTVQIVNLRRSSGFDVLQHRAAVVGRASDEVVESRAEGFRGEARVGGGV